MNGIFKGLIALGLVVPTLVGAQTVAMEAEQVQGELARLQEEGLWGELRLADGRMRSVKVESVAEDSAVVQQVVGAFQHLRAVYALSEIHSVRTLGSERIPPRRAVFGTSKSLTTALVLETLVPGAGYFYAGENGMGLTLLGIGAVVVGTIVATGEEGVAGTVPLAAWIKLGSLVHLRDEVRALNAANRQGLSVQWVPPVEGVSLGARLSYAF